MKFEKDDVVLTVDLEGNEELIVVTCVDNGIWSKGYVDDTEIFETYDEINKDYRKWIKVR